MVDETIRSSSRVAHRIHSGPIKSGGILGEVEERINGADGDDEDAGLFHSGDVSLHCTLPWMRSLNGEG